MARGGLLRRAPTPTGRVLTAAGTRLDLADKQTLRKIRKYRQGWQDEAWSYRDAIGELRYAHDFVGHACSRMRLFSGAYTDDPQAPPVPVAETNVDPKLAAASQAALDRLGTGKRAVAALLKTLAVNLQTVGEGYLLGRISPDIGIEEWSIRSIDEIVTADRGYHLRELPTDFTDGQPLGDKPLDPDETFIARLWVPHPRFRVLADSPMRALLELAEELLILSRGVRAQAKSRLAGAGLLLVPDELTLAQAEESDDNPTADPFLSLLTQAMTAPILDEASPSAVVPIVIRGPQAALDALKHIVLEQKLDTTAFEARAELIRRMATGLDLPSEVLTGMADLNHWTSWQVDDSTFRHHLEPAVLTMCDSLTQGYLWPALAAEGFEPSDYRRVIVWYDPTELVTHPDRTNDALQLWDRFAISDDALRTASGFTDSDRPEGIELVQRLVSHAKTFPPNVLEAIIHRLDPSLEIPADKNEPGETPDGTIPPVGLPDPSAPAVEPGRSPAVGKGQPEPGPPEIGAGPPSGGSAGRSARVVVAAGSRPAGSRRVGKLGARLAQIDHGLMSGLHASATSAVRRNLERAGAKARSKYASNRTVIEALRDTPNDQVCAVLGRSLSATVLAGFTVDLADFERDFYRQVRAAQARARTLVVDALTEVGAITAASPPGGGRIAGTIAKAQEEAAGQSYAWLRTAMERIVGRRTVGEDTINTGGQLVPYGLIRGATGLAGGYGAGEDTSGLGEDGSPVGAGEFLGGVAAGRTLLDVLAGGDIVPTSWEWIHDEPPTDFPPHLDLDGVVGATFNDVVFGGYEPGDHDGCRCVLQPSFDLAAAADEVAAPQPAELEPAAAAPAGPPVELPVHGDDALAAAPLGLGRPDTVAELSMDEAGTLRQYKGQAYANLNDVLRRTGGKLPAGAGYAVYREWTATIDGVMSRSALARPVEVYRALRDGSAVFGDAWGKPLTGGEFVDDSYLSTTADRNVVSWFHAKNAPDPAELVIRAPAGTRAVQLSGSDYESELLFQRGLKFRVVGDTGPGPGRIITLEVVR